MSGDISTLIHENILFGIRNDVCTSLKLSLTIVMRENNYGWRIDVFYVNERMMEDVISSEILNEVCPDLKRALIADYGI